MQKIWVIILLSLSLLVLSTCSGGSGSFGTGEGTLRVRLTDDPADYDGVFITIEKVLVHQSADATEESAGWKEIALNPTLAMPLNLLNLHDTSILLAEDSLSAGLYQQIRLVLVENTEKDTFNYVLLTPASGGEKVPLDIAPDGKSMFKIINQFEIVEGGTTGLSLDFDASASVIEAGSDKFLLTPVLKILSSDELSRKIESVYRNIVQTIGDANCSDNQQCDVLPIAQNPGVYLAYSTQDMDTEKLFELAKEHMQLTYELYMLTGQTHASGLIALPDVACIDHRCQLLQ